MANETDKTIVDKFQAIARAHTQVNSFSYHTLSQWLFSGDRDVEQPAIMLQKTGETQDANVRVRSYTLYSLQEAPGVYEYTQANQYDYDSRRVSARDTAVTTLLDVIGRFEGENRGIFTITRDAAINDTTPQPGAIGVRLDFDITSNHFYNDSNFPS